MLGLSFFDRLHSTKALVAGAVCGVVTLWIARRLHSANCKKRGLFDVTGETGARQAAGHLQGGQDVDNHPPRELDLEDAAAAAPVNSKLNGVVQQVSKRQQCVANTDREWTRDVVAGAADHLPGLQRIYVKTFGCPHNASDGEYMMGQLREYGYTLVDSLEECDTCVVNSCTVKHPSETRAVNLVNNAKHAGKGVVLAGCVPSSDRKLAESLEVSVMDVTQLDRIVDVVEQTIKGNTVKLLEKKKGLPQLSLPKVRKDKLAEIITINAGCLGNCTYCKTKLSRGKVSSYPIEQIIERAQQAAAEGVCQIELASEDMGAYGIDLGTNIVELLRRLSDALPPGVMLRTGMTNPPFIMYHI